MKLTKNKMLKTYRTNEYKVEIEARFGAFTGRREYLGIEITDKYGDTVFCGNLDEAAGVKDMLQLVIEEVGTNGN